MKLIKIDHQKAYFCLKKPKFAQRLGAKPPGPRLPLAAEGSAPDPRLRYTNVVVAQ